MVRYGISEHKTQASGWECGRVCVCHAWILRFYLQHLNPSMVVHAFTLRAWRVAGGSKDQGRQGLHAPLS